MTEAEEDELYRDISRRRLEAYLESRRHTKLTFAAAVLNGWTHDETMHYIKTGAQPAGKEFGQQG